MNSLFTISTEKNYKDGVTSPFYKNYRVYYDEELMKRFLRKIKFQYSQSYKAYGTMNDIETLKDFSIIDKVKSEIDMKGRCGKPDTYNYRYRRYPAIYKTLLNSLNAETFRLDVFVDYYKKLQENGELSLYFDSNLITYLSNKSVEKIKQNPYFQTNIDSFEFYTDKEFTITREEYKEILKKYFSLINLKYEALGSIWANTMKLAIRHQESLIYDDLFDDTLIAKKFRKI